MLTTADQNALAQQVSLDLEQDEGFREFAYPDPLSELAAKVKSKDWGFKPAREVAPPGTDFNSGNPWTVGYGFTDGVNPDSRMNKYMAARKLEELVLAIDFSLQKSLSWYKYASFATKTVLINMAYNLGLHGLLSFTNTLHFIAENKYEQAADSMLRSLWSKQVGQRAVKLADRLRTQVVKATQ